MRGPGSPARRPAIPSARHRGPIDANRDTPVVALAIGALLGAGLLAACSPPPPADPTSTLRDTSEGELDGDAEPAPDAASVAALPLATTRGPLVWLASETEALAQGRAERRPVLVHFATEWCADCKRMVSETFGDPRVKTEAGRFVAVRIDATNDEDPQVSAALSKYAVVNVPTLILLDSSGHETRRFTELIGPDTLLHEIDRVR